MTLITLITLNLIANLLLNSLAETLHATTTSGIQHPFVLNLCSWRVASLANEPKPNDSALHGFAPPRVQLLLDARPSYSQVL